MLLQHHHQLYNFKLRTVGNADPVDRPAVVALLENIGFEVTTGVRDMLHQARVDKTDQQVSLIIAVAIMDVYRKHARAIFKGCPAIEVKQASDNLHALSEHISSPSNNTIISESLIQSLILPWARYQQQLAEMTLNEKKKA